MKTKLKLTAFCTIAVSCLFLSCENDVNYETKGNNVKVVADLEKVNQNLRSSVFLNAKTRGSWSKETKIKVIGADLVGAWQGAKAGLSFGVKAGLGIGSPHLVGGGFCALGAVVGGAWSSWMAAPTMAVTESFEKIPQTCKLTSKGDLSINKEAIVVNDIKAIDKTNIPQAILEETKLDENSLRIAEMHNIILLSLDGSITLDETAQDMSEMDELKNKLLDSKEFMDSCKMVGLRSQDWKLETSDDVTAKIISLFNEVLAESSSKTEDIAVIIGKYMEVINDSEELTKEQKESIKCGLATGLYSSKYWEDVYVEPTK